MPKQYNPLKEEFSTNEKVKRLGKSFKMTTQFVGFLFFAAIAAYAYGDHLVSAWLKQSEGQEQQETKVNEKQEKQIQSEWSLKLKEQKNNINSNWILNEQYWATAGCLVMMLNSVIVTAISVLLYPIIKMFNQSIAIGYVCARLTEGIFLGFGSILLLTIVWVNNVTSNGRLKYGSSNVEIEDQENTKQHQNIVFFEQTLVGTLKTFQFLAYQTAMWALSIGSIPFCCVLFRSRLVHWSLSILGILGYLFLFIGAVIEILNFNVGGENLGEYQQQQYFGMSIGILFSLPGFVFEVSFATRLLCKELNFGGLEDLDQYKCVSSGGENDNDSVEQLPLSRQSGNQIHLLG